MFKKKAKALYIQYATVSLAKGYLNVLIIKSGSFSPLVALPYGVSKNEWIAHAW